MAVYGRRLATWIGPTWHRGRHWVLLLLLVVACDQRLRREQHWFDTGFGDVRSAMMEIAKARRAGSSALDAQLALSGKVQGLVEERTQSIRQEAKNQEELQAFAAAYEAGLGVVAGLNDSFSSGRRQLGALDAYDLPGILGSIPLVSGGKSLYEMRQEAIAQMGKDADDFFKAVQDDTAMEQRRTRAWKEFLVGRKFR